MSLKTFKIGTRGSLLALTQCTLIKNEIEKKTGAQFELDIIKTQGDQITDRPLWQLEGKDFFTKELDEALLAKKIDLVVHSYKDLGSERPEGIRLATISQRNFAHDILFIKKETIKKLNDKEEIIIGTSSPRRIVNIEKNLADFLPTKTPKKITCKTLRGNVNTRIQKLLDGEYDAIVLALAGVERLAHKEDSKAILKELVKDLNFMVLSQKVFPSSASQGALAIETNTKRDDDLFEILKSVHSNETEEVVARERKAFLSYGGGCHLAVGIHVLKHKDFFLHIHKGEQDGKVIDKMEIEGTDRTNLNKDLKAISIIGSDDPLIDKLPLETKIEGSHNLFVTSKHCLHVVKNNASNSLWAAGTHTMKELAKNGFWVNGSSDSLGHEEILKFQKSEVLKLMLNNDSWKTLSHDKAESVAGDVVPSYTRIVKPLSDIDFERLNSYDAYFWNSYFQYEEYAKLLPNLKDKIHATGLGKTYDKFAKNGIKAYPFIDMKEFENYFRG